MKKSKRSFVGQNFLREVVVHSNPAGIRDYHINAYKKQLSSLNHASEKLRHFTEVDQVAFTLWWQREFFDQLLAQTNLEKTLDELQLIVDVVEQYKIHHKCTYQLAYSVVSKAHAENKLSELMKKILLEMNGQKSKKSRKNKFDFSEQAFEDFLRDLSTDDNQSKANDNWSLDIFTALSPEETTDNYIKKAYRDLVRLLHPDAKKGEEQTAEEKALWHELQNAYEWRDLDRIEAIFRTVNGAGSAAINFATIPIGDIFAMKATVAKKLKDRRREIRDAKKQLNWDFEARRKKNSYLTHLAKTIQSEIDEQSMLLEFGIEKFKKRIQGWNAPRKQQKQKSSRLTTSNEIEDWI